MEFPGRIQAIEFLSCRVDIQRRHQDEAFALALEKNPHVRGFQLEQNQREAFREILNRLSDDKLRSMYEAEQARAQDEHSERAAQIEELFAASPFNAPDVEHWGRLPYWTIEEAVALLMNRSPSSLSPELVARFRSSSAFARQYVATQDLLSRYVTSGQLTEPLPPRMVLEWADSIGLAVSDGLAKVVARFQVRHPEPEPDKVEIRVAEPEQVLADESLGRRERTTLLTIIGALAKAAGIDLEKHQKAGQQISKMLDAEGISVAAQTIGNHLKAVREAMATRKR